MFTARRKRSHCGENTGERKVPIPLNPMPNPNPNQITVIYALQLPNVFRKWIVTFRRVPWIILF